jgi:2-polyprenyl-3-methyl-5-hydroxy-6-metoxy-1,4-benzoquinol methylase
MPLDFHRDAIHYWQMQYRCAQEYVIPFLENECRLDLRGKNVLEIGCGEGGVIAAFYDHGCAAAGMDISPTRLQRARERANADGRQRDIRFECVNILQSEQTANWQNQFDLIVMKDVIEHLPGHQQALGQIAKLLKPKSHLFFSFPPWYMPYGAHQQVFNSKLKLIPYTHLLPRSWFRALAQRFGEPAALIDELAALYDSRLSLAALNKLLRKAPFEAVFKKLYLTNPMYKYKLGLRPIPHPAFVARVPILRELITTAAYCTLRLKNPAAIE